jgi:small GTP-binding protein
MIKKKICMLGSFGVGKTSLTARFVHSIYEDKYHTSVGVKVDKKVAPVDGHEVTMMLWDMAGEEDNLPIKLNYVRDAAGYLLVIDGTRADSLRVAMNIQGRIASSIGDLPFVVAINKADQRESWEIQAPQLADLGSQGWRFFDTSAKTGEGVEDAFLTLARLMLQAQASRTDDSPTELV